MEGDRGDGRIEKKGGNSGVSLLTEEDSPPLSKPLTRESLELAIQPVVNIQEDGKLVRTARVRNPNWTINETLVLIQAKKRQLDNFNTAALRGRIVSRDQKWSEISRSCGDQGVERDGEQCRKRWLTVHSEYKKIRDWHSLPGRQSYWSMTQHDKKQNGLPAAVDRLVFDTIDSFMASTAGVQPPHIVDSEDVGMRIKDLPVVSAQLEQEAVRLQLITHGGSVDSEQPQRSYNCEQTRQLNGSASQSFEEEHQRTSTGRRKRRRTSQGEISTDRLVEAFERSTRLAIEAQERCTKNLMEVLGVMAKSMKEIADNFAKRQGETVVENSS